MLSQQFLTVKDVADLLKVGEVTVRHWIKDGDLRAIDVGREWRIAPADLENFLQRHESVSRSKGDAEPERLADGDQRKGDQPVRSPDTDEGNR
jgi:excisionase family DNA binding protein